VQIEDLSDPEKSLSGRGRALASLGAEYGARVKGWFFPLRRLVEPLYWRQTRPRVGLKNLHTLEDTRLQAVDTCAAESPPTLPICSPLMKEGGSEAD